MFAAVRKVCQLKVICIKIPLYLFPYMFYLGTGSCTLSLTKLRSQKYQWLIWSPPHIVFTKFHCKHIPFHLPCLCYNNIIYLFLWIFIYLWLKNSKPEMLWDFIHRAQTGSSSAGHIMGSSKGNRLFAWSHCCKLFSNNTCVKHNVSF